MSARFKVGDEVAIKAIVRDFGIDSDHLIVGVDDGVLSFNCRVRPSAIAQPATRAPWTVLREAAEIFERNGRRGSATDLRDYADSFEAAARPPSLLEAAKDALRHLPTDEHKIIDRLNAAIAAAEREASQ